MLQIISLEETNIDQSIDHEVILIELEVTVLNIHFSFCHQYFYLFAWNRQPFPCGMSNFFRKMFFLLLWLKFGFLNFCKLTYVGKTEQNWIIVILHKNWFALYSLEEKSNVTVNEEIRMEYYNVIRKVVFLGKLFNSQNYL